MSKKLKREQEEKKFRESQKEFIKTLKDIKCKKRLCENKSCKKCYLKSLASYSSSQYWNHEKNKCTPREICGKASTIGYFTCPDCYHDYGALLKNVNGKGYRCNYCANKILCGNCEICFNKSAASVEDIDEWDYERNEIEAKFVFKNASSKKYWLKCRKCRHPYDTTLNDHHGCFYCNSNALCIDDNCEICWNNSFASSKYAIYWDYIGNGDKKPRNTRKNCNDKFYMICAKQCHTYMISLNNMNQKDQGCPYHSKNSKLLCDWECKECFANSCASHPLMSKYWNFKKNRGILPRDIRLNSNSYFYFNCEECGSEIHDQPLHINIDKRWCPVCVNKTEKQFLKWFQETFKYNITHQFRAPWCRGEETKKYYPFDFVVEDLKLIVEIDGRQHFTQVRTWMSPKETRIRDVYKMKKAIKNGYTIIRIFQEDIYYERIDWKKELCDLLEMGDKRELVSYITKDKELYNAHREIF